MLHLENRRTYKGPGIYCGREMPGLPGSVLGNPFKVGPDGSIDEVLQKYRVWLWNQIQRKSDVYYELLRIAGRAKYMDVTLICWCKPAPCHLDIIVRAIDWLSKQSLPFDEDPEAVADECVRGFVLDDDVEVEKYDEAEPCVVCGTPTHWQLVPYIREYAVATWGSAEVFLPSGIYVRRDIRVRACSKGCVKALSPHTTPTAKMIS